MKSIIIYDTVQGFTKECAEFIYKHTPEASMMSMEDIQDEMINYDEIYIGTHILKGSISYKTQKFLKKNHAVLLDKKLKLFISALDKSDYEHALQTSLHPEIYYRAIKVNSGGRIIYKELSFLKKKLIKRFTDTKQDLEEFNEDKLLDLIKK